MLCVVRAVGTSQANQWACLSSDVTAQNLNYSEIVVLQGKGKYGIERSKELASH